MKICDIFGWLDSIARHSFLLSEVAKKLKQGVAGSIAAGFPFWRCGSGERFLLHCQCCLHVDLGGLDRFVAEPECDHRTIHVGLQELHGRGMAQPVDGYSSMFQRRTSRRGPDAVFVQQVLNAMDSQPFALGVGKEHVPVAAWRLPQPVLQHGAGRFGQRRAPCLASLADDAQVSAAPRDEVLSFQTGHLG